MGAVVSGPGQKAGEDVPRPVVNDITVGGTDLRSAATGDDGR